MLQSDIVKEDFIYYKDYDKFRVFFIIDECGLACMIENFNEMNQVAYVADTLGVDKINESILILLNVIILVDKTFTETKLEYNEIGDEILNLFYFLYN